MAAASSRRGAAGLALAAALCAPPGAAQQSLDQPVYAPPSATRGIETRPLPPIGGDAGGAGGAAGARIDGGGIAAPAGPGVGPATDADQAATLPQPRFLRVPQAGGDGQGGGQAGGDASGDGGRATLEGAETDPGWQRSPDGRFHRAPEAEEPAGSAATAPGPVVPIDPPATALRAGARLRELDKMTGQTKTFEIAVGETRDIDRLRIELDACRSPEGNDMHGTMAFLKVWDTRRPEEAAFSGWMFAESPALSALDHPRYDLWVISCTTSDAAASAPSE